MKQNLIIVIGVLILPFLAQAQVNITRDDNSNVLSETYPNGFSITYTYDANGNRVSQLVSGTALPVTLTEFTAVKQTTDVLLKWTTSQEINTDRFVVEFSKDAVSFVPIDTVAAHGNSTSPLSYSTIHCCPVVGVNYYRLKIIDRDGKVTYSQVRAVVFSDSQGFKLFPNPVGSNQINISFNKPLSQDAELTVYTFSGSAAIVKTLRGGSNTYTVNVSYLPAGSYQLVIHSGESVFGGTFIRQ